MKQIDRSDFLNSKKKTIHAKPIKLRDKPSQRPKKHNCNLPKKRKKLLQHIENQPWAWWYTPIPRTGRSELHSETLSKKKKSNKRKI
jgi:hypothetical protein